MIHYQDAIFKNLSIHYVGNKHQDQYYSLGKSPVDISEDEVLPDLLLQYFFKPFAKVEEEYCFFHPNEDLELNVVYHFINSYFSNDGDFHSMSQELAKHLYEVTSHPNIKPGEMYITQVEDITFKGEDYEAIGIFKSENKDTYLKVYPKSENFEITYEQEAININKLDKGVLVLFHADSKDFKVFVVDQTNKQDAVYWKDDFLQVKQVSNEYAQTGNLMKVYKKFVQKDMDELFELEAVDKIDLLNRSLDFLKNNEVFEQEKFQEEVIGHPSAIALYKQSVDEYEKEFEVNIGDQFTIAAPAVKKHQNAYKSVLKLDRNFHIYVHGNRDLIEKGFDEARGMNYYKVYFEEEK